VLSWALGGGVLSCVARGSLLASAA